MIETGHNNDKKTHTHRKVDSILFRILNFKINVFVKVRKRHNSRRLKNSIFYQI